ncbi:pyridoxamine 5'-phosphate oxidase family protein [Saccharothrix sp. AJ9571]|nr:pyridoxamine 5'-phosphate oxidase family protein [Saccharothrix sp. AJ9571]
MSPPPEPAVTDQTGQPLTSRQCWQLLHRTAVGRLVYTHHALPAVCPARFTAIATRILIPTTEQPWLPDLTGQVIAVHADELSDTGPLWTVTVVGHAQHQGDIIIIAAGTQSATPPAIDGRPGPPPDVKQNPF